MRVGAQQHVQLYRMVSVAAGVFLGTAALGVAAFAVYEHEAVGPLAWVLGPVAGLAGVFVYGYRPTTSAAGRPLPDSSLANDDAVAGP